MLLSLHPARANHAIIACVGEYQRLHYRDGVIRLNLTGRFAQPALDIKSDFHSPPFVVLSCIRPISPC